MTAKNRNKSNSHSNDKIPAHQQDDVAKKSTKVVKAENASVSGPCGSGSGTLMKCISALFYLALAGGAALASFYFQQVLSEVKLMNLRNEESIGKYAELANEVERSSQQISAVKTSLEGLEAAVVSAKTDLRSTSHAVQREEAETRRIEETLQNLQNKIFRDLTNGIQEVKDAREKDVSSLERTLEERLAQLSRSIAESVSEFAGEQSQYKNELRELKARLEEQNIPEFLKKELTSVNSALANLNTANEVAEGNMEVLREQIAAVGAELQTRNKEVASVSEEIDTVRMLVQNTVGALREEASVVRTSVQATSDQVQSLSDRQDQSSEALRTLETQLREELLKVEKRGDDVEVRLKATEESEDLLASSLSEQTSRLDALTSKYESHESLLNNYKTTAEKDRLTLRDDLEELKTNLGELKTSVAALDEAQVEQKLDGLGERNLDGLGDAEDLEEPQEPESTVDSQSEQLDGPE